MGSTWWVVIEEQGGAGDGRGWGVADAAGYADRDVAFGEARLLAEQHRPPRPSSPQKRVVLRVTDGYLVLVKGKTDVWQFRVTVGEQAGG
ncbi:hypothetical protein MUY14_16750 [Amycolatopsis sp. FBCC-B4732]|uniref:hypothetical protein n=1 Tax=Amycolatopsis sp. FBCC-B4732 TaxID=3079339 RepID=UPI001FF554B7|nr:hypothetical protein [Amycolatopsis sp. FBCC-B4732]UOX92190.1 hypothetical protein MUY14_16750 [Amycolatopsis sp. FBCC-B4732]